MVKYVFLKVLALPGFHREKYDVALRLSILAKEEEQFLRVEDISEELLESILEEDNDALWRLPLLRYLPGECGTRLLHRISKKVEMSEFHFKILYFIIYGCEHPLCFPEGFSLCNFVTCLRVCEFQETNILGIWRTPFDILFSCCELMDDAMVARQRDLFGLLEKADVELVLFNSNAPVHRGRMPTIKGKLLSNRIARHQ